LSTIHIIIPLISVLILSYAIDTAGGSNYGVFTSESSPYETPYPEWIGKWWTWWLGIPNELHPVNNYSDSIRCSTMQNGPVWFLPDIIPGKGKIDYSCNVPSGKAILLPLTTTICERGIEGNLTDTQLKECADNILTPVSNMIVTVDGKQVDVSKSNAKSNFFNVTFPNHPATFWGPVKPGTYTGTATGYFLFLHDLPKGEHNIQMKVVDLLKGNEGPPPKFDPPREATFKINVQ
jgi:hypothetical protein